MASITSKISPDTTRQQILDAATERFTQFGYNKTTMAEIANDCHMSAANLYRHFENKLDIGANLACDCLNNKVAGMREIIDQKNRPAGDRLRELFLHVFHYTHEQWSENPRMNEMVNAICESRLDIVDDYKLDEHAILVELIEDGIKRGEFSIDHVENTANGITTAMSIFSIPLLMPMHSFEYFESSANNVASLLLNGMLARDT